MPETLVMLHGFGGTRQMWDRVAQGLSDERYLPLALDLPGHGQAAGAERPITFAGCVEHVLAHSPERFALCGYSLGGRVALTLALAAPERVAQLVLLSSTAGIEDAGERARRRRADRELADELERIPFEDFIERWRMQPLFLGDPPEVDELAREELRRNRPAALAEVLRGLGTGEMEPLWDRLAELKLPVTVLAGARDAKFRAIGERMASRLTGARMLVVPGGHNLALENPRALVAALEQPL